jgi:hypothetical protein
MTMNATMLRGIGVGLIVLGLILGFVGIERYQANANNVAAMKQMMGGFPMGDMLGLKEINPGMPAASKYALFFAALSLAGGVVCLVMAPRLCRPAALQPDAPGQ